jgi:tetratricopeptide (TPR) repeat protein
LHIPAPASFEGRSLLGAGGGRGEPAPRPVYAESLHTHDSFGWSPLRSVRVGALQYIEAPRAELYNLQDDPHETNNLLARNPGEGQSLRSQLHALLSRYAPKTPAAAADVSAQTRALLGSLGYLAPGPGAMQGSGADPKDRMAEFQLYEKAQTSLYYGRVEEAAATLKSLLARDPKNTLARRDLGGCYIEEKQWAKARDSFQQVLAAAPEDYMTEFELGLAYKGLGLLREARQHIETACAAAPEAGQCRRELAALAQKGR